MRAAREFVIANLKKHLPKGWRVMSNLDSVDRLSAITVIVSTNRFQRAAAAPIGAYDSTVNLRLLSPNSDFRKAELELDDALDVLLPAIENHLQTAMDEAEKTTDTDFQALAWDIPLHVFTSRKD